MSLALMNPFLLALDFSDYGTIERDGFLGRVFARDGGPVVVRSPHASQ